MPEPRIQGDAATVVILRDGAAGVEVLLLERPAHGSFAGAWAFPGGRVDPEDALAEDDFPDASAEPQRAPLAVRRAAVRETLEETNLALWADSLVDLSVWVPPQRAEKRLRTWFFLAKDPGTEIRLNDGEHVAFAWVAPAVALERHARGEMTLFPPTWVTLHGLLGSETTALVLAEAASREPELYASLQLLADDGRVEAVLWSGDAQYGNPASTGPARHRLHMESLPWVYERKA
ncbi:NUDIX hydrolase [Sinomonas gamaensis]|uniref:NUDIX hydrolase n=1 Tax=Sinomonas gamaensis TaxID=2565624 RepID=UPI001107E1B6|nr:NUDIX hydrolase [Sinomonas gamaensis]